MLHEVPRLYLTDSFILNVKCPSNKDQILYWDHPKTLEGNIRHGAQAGLGLRVTSQGAKSFIHTFHFNGKRKRTVIAKAEKIGISSARLLVQQRDIQIESGLNPDAIKTNYRRKHALTFRDIVDEYFDTHICKLSPKYQQEYARYIAPWHAKQRNTKNKRGRNMNSNLIAFGATHADSAAKDITPSDIGVFIHKINSDHIANAALKQLKALYNWAIRMQLIDIRNPCSPHQNRKIIRQRRDYTPEDIATLAAYIFNPPIEASNALLDATPRERQIAALKRGALHHQNAQMDELCHFLGILFLTMARPNELKQAQFDHFDLKRLIWHKHNTKGIKLSKATYEYAYRSVPIHPKVAELVRQQKQRWPESNLVFPSHTDFTKPRDNFNKALSRFKKLDGVPNHFQLYDVKRIAISLMLTGQGINREDVSHYVDHKGNLETTMIYDLGFVDPMRPVAERLGELLGV